MKLSAYWNWLKDHWPHTGVILGLYLTLFLFVFVRPQSTPLFLIGLALPVYLLHETEEYLFPGGFARFFNRRIFRSGRDSGPLGRTFIFWVNILLIWVLLPLFWALSTIDLRLGLWIPYFCLFAGVAHIVLGLVGRCLYNPGLVVSLLGNIPYGVLTIRFLAREGLLLHPFWNLSLLIGLGLNLMLPVLGRILLLKDRRTHPAAS